MSGVHTIIIFLSFSMFHFITSKNKFKYIHTLYVLYKPQLLGLFRIYTTRDRGRGPYIAEQTIKLWFTYGAWVDLHVQYPEKARDIRPLKRVSGPVSSSFGCVLLHRQGSKPSMFQALLSCKFVLSTCVLVFRPLCVCCPVSSSLLVFVRQLSSFFLPNTSVHFDLTTYVTLAARQSVQYQSYVFLDQIGLLTCIANFLIDRVLSLSFSSAFLSSPNRSSCVVQNVNRML